MAWSKNVNASFEMFFSSAANENRFNSCFGQLEDRKKAELGPERKPRKRWAPTPACFAPRLALLNNPPTWYDTTKAAVEEKIIKPNFHGDLR